MAGRRRSTKLVGVDNEIIIPDYAGRGLLIFLLLADGGMLVMAPTTLPEGRKMMVSQIVPIADRGAIAK